MFDGVPLWIAVLVSRWRATFLKSYTFFLHFGYEFIFLPAVYLCFLVTQFLCVRTKTWVYDRDLNTFCSGYMPDLTCIF